MSKAELKCVQIFWSTRPKNVTYAFARLKINTRDPHWEISDDPKRIMSTFWQTCCEYGEFYAVGIRHFWKTLRPGSYTVVLLTVWLFGFLLMKSGIKRY